jgi:uncharacterized protein (UPF0548 family)
MIALSLRRPIAAVGDGVYSYNGIGSTGGGIVPPGYRIDTAGIRLGSGPAIYAAARAAIDEWAMFRMSWIQVDAPSLETGRTVSVIARVLGLWVQGPCRIVDVVDRDDGRIAEHGFSYATLVGHPMCGEERFLVRWDRMTDHVGFEIIVHSRPGGALFWAGYPIVRIQQARFRRQALAAMQASVG